MTPPILDKAELFCHNCLRWKPRAAIVAAKWARSGKSQRVVYRCCVCQDKIERTLRPRHGG